MTAESVQRLSMDAARRPAAPRWPPYGQPRHRRDHEPADRDEYWEMRGRTEPPPGWEP